MRAGSGVTPALLSTEVSRTLLARLEKLGQRVSQARAAKLQAKRQKGKGGQAASVVAAPMHWDELLFAWATRHDWSEYALYWTHACDSGLLEKLHMRN